MKIQSAIVTAAVTLGLAVPVASAATKPPVRPSALAQTTSAIPGSCTLTMVEEYLSIYVCTGGAAGAPAIKVIGKSPVVVKKPAVVKKKGAAPVPSGCLFAPSDRQLSAIICAL